MLDTRSQRLWVGIDCVKNVYRRRKLSGKTPSLYTALWDIPQTSGYKLGGSPRFHPHLIPGSIHSLTALITPVISTLYPLSTAPIISSYEVRKERN